MHIQRLISSHIKRGLYNNVNLCTVRRLCFQSHLEFLPSTNYFLNYKSKNVSIVYKKASIQIPSIALNFPVRGYAKGKDKKKSDKGKKHVSVDESALAELVDIGTLRSHLQKTVDVMKDEYIKQLSLRSTTGSFENLKIKFDGSEYTLQDLAQIVRKNPKTIVVNLSSFPTAIPPVLEAIQKSGMNLNPQQDGTTLFIPVPKITKEHREALSKNAKSLFIKCRDSLKDVQTKFIKGLKGKDHVSKDDVFSAQQQITTLCNFYVAEAEKIMETKQKELLGKD
ncbi:hypothetical protein J437_LFUL000878 [Ladona fulva]|uniref:Ribosome-recycling factor, mitochondrial n=1 Tax=Ladona fulva TaxID=123851 RepID=A0A8K0K7Y1_LADFU|nr:hypothetical protein J437_LFUL000878 [Ladona fulva]